ncbi:alpha-L-fucosidase [Pedobacter nyackensis]|uniref:alpha-L-fucosidase n=1 Tax=Pedobacter nyackensis TaxID=475255 RepID=A0A1W2FAD7_9SPHI|nr:alpha-L-fucosidase [Pedobacter nyackensis]SMD18516.1 alpha-L-fucosidase [Pedobacter nyackensis]
MKKRHWIFCSANFKYTLYLSLAVLFSIPSYAQEKEKSWEELKKDYEFPAWYTEARFGIWLHWGGQSQPDNGGGWYARHMYMQDVGGQTFGKDAYANQLKQYGHPSKFGYKEVLQSWKAEKLDPNALMKYFKEMGAKYFMVLAVHHDHFDDFNSTYQKWNSVNVGPKRDIVGDFRQAARKYKMPFAVSSHDDRYLSWWLSAFGSDKSGPLKGVPYDGNLTKEDGKGLWWDGLDPADLYGMPPAKRTPEWIADMKKTWVLRHKELVTKYDVDMIWYDGYGFPYGEPGKEVCRTLFENSLKKNGKIMAVAAGKISEDDAIVKDIECGTSNDINPKPWQGIITTSSGWFYKKDREMVHNARTIIEMMADVNSKNGNLLLNVELLPNGSLSSDEKAILDEVGAWVNKNSAAIYASKPWKVYGDNLNSILKRATNIANADLEALKKQAESEQFNQRTIKSPPYGNDEVRFTTKANVLYVFVLNPTEGEIALPTLGLKSNQSPNKIKSIKTMDGKKVAFNQTDEKLTFKVPANRLSKYAAVFEVKGAL